MRVISGTAGGRKLKGPASIATRPMTDRTREAIFNALTSLGATREAKCVDLFAGTGALGIEALSRGADLVHICRSERGAIGVIKDNIEARWLLRPSQGCDGRRLVFRQNGCAR